MSRKFRFTGLSYKRVKEYVAPLIGFDMSADKKKDMPEERDNEPEDKDTADQAEKMIAVMPQRPVVTRTDVGRVRKNNQDTVINAWPLIGVADGMGGHKGGEVASGFAKDTLIPLLQNKQPDEATLEKAIAAVNRKLFVRQSEEEALSGMGTTLTVLWISPDAVLVGHVGDSRAYRLRDGKLQQITQDHSMVAEMVRQGVLTPQQAAMHPMRNVITRAVGTDDTVEVDVIRCDRKPGDLWLVCSDGLYGMVGDTRICEILTEDGIEVAADELLRSALQAGGRDNVSLVLMQDEEAAE